MAEIPDVVTGEVVASNWGNDVRDRTVQRYTDATDRDALNPTPTQGDIAYLYDVAVLQIFDGSVWQSRNILGSPSVRAVWDTTELVPVTVGAGSSLTVALSGFTVSSKMHVSIFGNANTVQSLRTVYGFVSLTTTSISIRAWPTTGMGADGDASVRLQIVEYY